MKTLSLRSLVPQSLRGRLLAAMCAVLLVVVALMLTGHAAMLKRQQTGTIDSMLRVIAHQILLSLPEYATRAADGGRPAYRLPAALAAADAEATGFGRSIHDKADWQVWSADGRLALRSPGAPAQPFQALQQDGFRDAEVGGRAWRVYSVRDAEGKVVVQVACSRESLRAELARWAAISSKAAVVVFLLLAAAVWFVICWSLGPAERLQRDIAARDTMAFAPFPTAGLPHELAPLVEAFNGLLQRLEGSVQSERRFIADAAHELRTPLAALLAQTEVARAVGDAAGRDAALARLAEGVARCTRVAEQLLDSARLDAGGDGLRRERVWLYEIVEVVARDFEATARARGQRLLLELGAAEVEADVDLLGILLRNLIDNALRYGREGGVVTVRCDDQGAAGVTLSVGDDGPGVPEAERARIFERFYRVPGSGPRGSGVGLSLVARIAALHGATLEACEGDAGKGLCVALRFPARAGGETADSAAPDERHLARHDGHELHVGVQRQVGHGNDGVADVANVHARLGPQ